EKLVEIPGIGEKTAEKVLATAQEYVAAHPAQPAQADAGEMEFTPEMEATDTSETEAPAPAAPEHGAPEHGAPEHEAPEHEAPEHGSGPGPGSDPVASAAPAEEP